MTLPQTETAPPEWEAGEAEKDEQLGGALGSNYSSLPDVPEGEYNANFLGHATRYIAQNPKAVLRFALADEYAGIELCAYRNCWVEGTAKTDGRFRLSGRKSKLYRELLMVAQDRGTKPPSRPDRVSVEPLRGDELLRVRVRVIDSDPDGDPLPESERYAIVDKILGTAAGADLRASGASPTAGPSAIASATPSACPGAIAGAGVGVSARASAGAGAGAGASSESPQPARECGPQADGMDSAPPFETTAQCPACKGEGCNWCGDTGRNPYDV